MVKFFTYLDSGATSQKPKIVLDKMNEIYTVSNANVTLEELIHYQLKQHKLMKM